MVTGASIWIIRFGEPFSLCAECALRDYLRQVRAGKNAKNLKVRQLLWVRRSPNGGVLEHSVGVTSALRWLKGSAGRTSTIISGNRAGGEDAARRA